ncbi:ComEA family DNA-binding protein [Streptomyces zingiberis]|uniref:ComEA family DNA-binding protein n=1 Tax=Streptomyces zingiberis TaxID=2053010 RepID=A0ABX1BSL0_9ACTN|nr:ComEA family DNA-binding protein [Streptomyces zingiberis]NJP99442.1 ComEA family DNA-binding protein [Streptomyces zingiberis]
MDLSSRSVADRSALLRDGSGDPHRAPGRAPDSDRHPRHRHRARRPTAPGHDRPGPSVTPRARAGRLFGELPESGPLPSVVPGPAGGGRAEEPEVRWPTRWWLAVRERLPLWVRARCGTDPRTLAALAVVLALAVGYAGYHFWTGRAETVRARSAEPAAAEAPAEPGTAAGPGGAAPARAHGSAPAVAGGGAVVVDVVGKVRRPGVQRLPAGSRVADALRAAGGVRDGTDTDGLNRARILTDGEQIVVGAPAADPPAAGGAPAGAAGPGTPAVGGGGGTPTAPISLGTATLEQLDGLPGVGPVLAQRILDHRDQQGGFSSVDQLREVNGIGERRFADISPLVRP